MGSGAAPADMPRKHISGRPRVAVRAHYGALPSVAGRARTRGGESCPAREVTSLRPVAGRTAPGTEIAANEPRRRKLVWVERREARWTLSRSPCRAPKRGIVTAPFGAPLPSFLGSKKRHYGVARAASTGPAELWLSIVMPAKRATSNRRQWLLDHPVIRRREATPSSTAMPDDHERKVAV
jgi:hypothetical protein